MQTLLNAEASFVLISAAARMGHSMGLHRWLDEFGLSKSEMEQRRRVFWIIYTLDKSTSIRTGRPPSIHDEDIGVLLPADDQYDEENTGSHIMFTPKQKFYPFRASCDLALIESRVYSELYSARSFTKQPCERLAWVIHLDEELQEWKDSIPIEISPEHTIQCGYEHQFSIIMLHFAYYNCVTAVHRVGVHHSSWTCQDADLTTESSPTTSLSMASKAAPLKDRILSSYALCLSAARSTINTASQFFNLEDDPRSCLVWIAIYFPFTASLTLVAHALQSPFSPTADIDLELVERTLEYLHRPSNISAKSSGSLMVDMLSNLVVIAREHIKKSRNKRLADWLSSRKNAANTLESASFEDASYTDCLLFQYSQGTNPFSDDSITDPTRFPPVSGSTTFSAFDFLSPVIDGFNPVFAYGRLPYQN